MNLLLDTQAILWFAANSMQLSPKARSFIEDGENNRYLSIASLWEISIKSSIGKLRLNDPLEKFAADVMSVNMTSVLNIEVINGVNVASLPYHHRDPFDRIIVAQALNRQFTLVSSDRQLDAYGVQRVW